MALGSLNLHQDFKQASLASSALVGNTASFARGDQNASYFNSSGLLVFAGGNDTPRLQSYVGGANKGLLIEGSRTNLQLFSEALNTANAGWVSAVRMTLGVDTGEVAAPDGNNTATKITENTDDNTHHLLGGGMTIAAAATYVTSCFFSQLARTHAAINVFGSTIASEVLFDLAAKNVEAESGSDTLLSGLIDINSLWDRCWHSFNDATGTTTAQNDLFTNEDGATVIDSYVGDVTKGIYAWGASLELGAFPSSYIKTTSAAVTRLAETCTIAHALSSSLGYTVVLVGRTPLGQGADDQVLWEHHDGAESDLYKVVRAAADGHLHVLFYSGGAEVEDLDCGALADDTDFVLAFAAADGDFRASLDGGTVIDNGTLDDAPTGLTTVEVGHDSSDASHWFGHIAEARIYTGDADNGFLQDPFTIDITGTAAQSVPSPSQSGAGEESSAGIAAQGIPGPTQAAIGTEAIALTGAAADGGDVTYSGESVAPASGDARQVVFSTDDGTEDNYETLYRDANDDLIFEWCKDGGTVYRCNAGNVGDGETFAWAVRAGSNNTALIIDGWPPSLADEGERPIVDTLRSGGDLNGNGWGGTVGEIVIAEAALSDAVLEAATDNFDMVGTVHVDPVDGDDGTGDGSFEAPFKTLDHVHDNAATLLPAGTTLLLKDSGVHENRTSGAANLTFQNSGTRRRPIVVDSYGSGGRAIVRPIGPNDQDVIGSYVDKGAGLWYLSYAGTSIYGLWKEGVRLAEADSIADLDAASPFRWDDTGTDPDNGGEGPGIWLYLPSGVPGDFYISKGQPKTAFKFNGLAYCIVRNVQVEECALAIEADDNGSVAAHHIVFEDSTVIGCNAGFDATNDIGGGGHHCMVRRVAITGYIIAIRWTANNGAIEQKWNSAVDNDIGQADFDDIIEKFLIHRGEGGSDHELISGQNMTGFRCIRNKLDVRLNVSQIVPWIGLALWVRGTAPLGAMDDVQWSRNFFAGFQHFGTGFGAGATDSLTKNGRSSRNIYLDCAVGEKFNVNNTTPGNETITAHNTYHNCDIDIELAFGNGVIAKSNLHSGTNTYLIKSTQAHGNNEFDFNGYAGAGSGTPFHLNGSDLSFADWKTNTDEDANSTDTTPTFAGGANPTTAAGFRQTADSDGLGKGVAVDGIVKDFEGLPYGANLLGAFATVETIAADAAQSISAPSQAGSGTETLAGAGAQDLPAAAQVASGGETAAGTAAQETPAAVQAATGSEILAATAAQVLGGPAQAAAGTAISDTAGAAAQDLGGPVQAADGAETFTSTAAQAISAPAQAAAGTSILDVTGSAGQALDGPAQDAAGGETATGAAGQSIDGPAQDAGGSFGGGVAGAAAQGLAGPSQAAGGTAILDVAGNGAQGIPAPAQAAGGAEIIGGASAQDIPQPAQDAAGGESTAGAGTQNIPAAAQAAEGTAILDLAGAGAQSLAGPAQAGAGDERIDGTGAGQAVASPRQAAAGDETAGGTSAQIIAFPVQAAAGGENLGAVAAMFVPAPVQGAVGVEITGDPRVIGTLRGTIGRTTLKGARGRTKLKGAA